MQTFLPYPDIALSVRSLDNKRLGKQRVEASQILDILIRGKESKWQNHPAVRMWRGYEELLKFYYNQCIFEWERRMFDNNMALEIIWDDKIAIPWWWGDPDFHVTHQANLLRKDVEYYHFFHGLDKHTGILLGYTEELAYLWPGDKEDENYYLVPPSWAIKQKDMFYYIKSRRFPLSVEDKHYSNTKKYGIICNP